jgi:DNA (cytosine-5)-methyltransferase 1
LSVPANDVIVTGNDRRNGIPWSIRTIFKGNDPSQTELDARELRWLEAWDDFVKTVPDESLPGFPIWVDAWYGRMKRPGRRSGSVATLRADRSGHAGLEGARWWTDFVEKNRAFYKRHATLLDMWMAKWQVTEFPESRRKLEWQARRHHPFREGRTLRDCLIQLRPSGIRAKPPTYAPALVAMAQTPVIGIGDTWRRIGPAEAAVLQGIRDFRPWRDVMKADPSFTAGAAYKQLGNAVNVGIAALVLRRAVEHIESITPGWMDLSSGSRADS